MSASPTTAVARVESPFGAVAQREENAGSRQLQQRENASVMARVQMAKMFPRDQIECGDRAVNAFTRPSLAQMAQYQYSKGGTNISGPSIRAAEAIAGVWGNIDYGFHEVQRGVAADGVPFSEVEAYAWDMESNTRRPVQFIIRHWRDRKGGGYKLTDEREIYELIANQAQRRVRACILAIIPGDVVEAAMEQAEKTLAHTEKVTPDSIKKMIEAFATFGVTKDQLEKRIQKRMDAIQPGQMIGLRKVYASLKDGMATPGDFFEMPTAQQGDTEPTEPGARTAGLAGKLKKTAATTPPTDQPKAPLTEAEQAEAALAARDAAQQQ